MTHGVLIFTALLTGLVTHSFSNDDSTQAIWNYSLEDLMIIKVVTPSKTEEQLREAPSIVSVVTRKEIENYGANSLFDVLDRVAGLYIYGSYYLPNNMITIRGDATSSYCTHVLLLINGRPFHSSKEGYDLPFINAFPLNVVERIEIIRGPGSALYGTTAYAGAINVITQKAEDQKTGAQVTTGSFGTQTATMATGARKGDLGFAFGSYFKFEEGWVRKVRDGDADSLFPLFNAPVPERAFGVHSSLSYKKVQLNVFAGQNYLMNGYELKYVVGWPELNLGTTHATVDLGYSNAFSDKYRLDLNATYNYQHYWQPFDINAHDDREYGYSNDILFEVSNHLNPTRRLELTVGALTTINTGYIYNNEQFANGAPNNVWTNPHNTDPYQVVPDYTETLYSGYVNASFLALENLKLVAGAHANKAPELDVDVVPRVGLIADLSRHVNYKLLYGEAYRSPDVFERFSKVGAIVGNRTLKPERISTLESQLSYTRKSMYVAVSAFKSWQSNLINRLNVVDTIIVAGTRIPVQQRFVNEGNFNSQGMEMEGTLHATGSITFNTSLSYQENETQDGQEDIFGVPNLFAKFGASVDRPQFSAGLFVSRYDYLDVIAGYPVAYPQANPPVETINYVTLHGKVNWKSLLRIQTGIPEISTDVYAVNLLDERIFYPEHGRRFVNSTPGRPGFAVYAGLKVVL